MSPIQKNVYSSVQSFLYSWNLNLLSYIYWNFCANLIIFLADIEENKNGCFFIETICILIFAFLKFEISLLNICWRQNHFSACNTTTLWAKLSRVGFIYEVIYLQRGSCWTILAALYCVCTRTASFWQLVCVWAKFFYETSQWHILMPFYVEWAIKCHIPFADVELRCNREAATICMPYSMGKIDVTYNTSSC